MPVPSIRRVAGRCQRFPAASLELYKNVAVEHASLASHPDVEQLELQGYQDQRIIRYLSAAIKPVANDFRELVEKVNG